MVVKKTLQQKKWHRGEVQKKCLYCKESFLQMTPWQEYCTDSHRVMASRERKESK